MMMILGFIRVIIYDGLQVVKVTSPRLSFAAGHLNWSLENHTSTRASDTSKVAILS